MPVPALRGVYLITPDCEDTDELVRRVGCALRGGPILVQYRNKAALRRLRSAQARALRTLCASAGVRLIVNDDAKLAAEIGADGVHLGEEDGDVAGARALLGPNRLIGVSCYDRLELAQQAKACGADYVAFGAFYPSNSKSVTRQASLDLLRDSAHLGLPRAAIGGLNPANIGPLVAAGVELLAVIDAVFSANDPAAVVSSMRAILDNAHSEPKGTQHGRPEPRAV